MDYGYRYDWVSPHGSRTPQEYPYSHDEFYLWRKFKDGDESVTSAYTDRMREWDAEKYARATKDRMTNYNSVPKSRAAADEIVAAYFGPKAECVGVAQSMNHSNGYPLGIFFIRRSALQEGE